eukprot:GHUV01044648.1.p1 GENE.GHUV01044648.1~~GHUV01044648.1.p1  ORF type:complete len:167 (-),score=21.07 GHUV01044648.1:22-522(-)
MRRDCAVVLPVCPPRLHSNPFSSSKLVDYQRSAAGSMHCAAAPRLTTAPQPPSCVTAPAMNQLLHVFLVHAERLSAGSTPSGTNMSLLPTQGAYELLCVHCSASSATVAAATLMLLSMLHHCCLTSGTALLRAVELTCRPPALQNSQEGSHRNSGPPRRGSRPWSQ